MSFAGTVYLEDVSSELPGLKRRKGLSSWRVMDEGGHWRDIDGADDVNVRCDAFCRHWSE